MTPKIIHRKEHCISRKHINPNALRILYRLHTHGFIAYLVGGCVRDLLMGRTPKDFDIGTNATPGQVRRLFRNCRLVGRRFRLAHIHFQDGIVEVSTFRRTAIVSDSMGEKETAYNSKTFPRHMKDENGMILVDNVFGTPEEDALRRDFTINALAYNIADFSVIDYSTGIKDLQQKLIHTIGNPRIRFVEDPVRMLRAIRFAASHGFTIEKITWENIYELAPVISRVSPARLYEEIQKIFLLGYALPSFNLLFKSRLLSTLFPALDSWIKTDDNHLKLLKTNLKCIDQFYRNNIQITPALFMAILFGTGLEKTALANYYNGIPFQQAIDKVSSVFMGEISKTVSIPKLVFNRMRAILNLQPLLRRTPPRRPSSIAKRPEFKESLTYFHIKAETIIENLTPLKWWEKFLVNIPSVEPSESSNNKTLAEKRRKRKLKTHKFPKKYPDQKAF